jgi:hypothetical protein
VIFVGWSQSLSNQIFELNILEFIFGALSAILDLDRDKQAVLEVHVVDFRWLLLFQIRFGTLFHLLAQHFKDSWSRP